MFQVRVRKFDVTVTVANFLPSVPKVISVFTTEIQLSPRTNTNMIR